MSFSQVIKGTLNPAIPLLELSELDDSPKSGNLYTKGKAGRSAGQVYGATAPLIKINGETITETSIESFILDETGFIPTCTLVFEDVRSIFSGDAFPKTDLIMSIYLKTQNPKFKPIRCDFLITSLKSMASSRATLPTMQQATYIIKGELFIPKIYDNVSKSYSKVSSKEALTAVAKELGLGFAENECNPSDSMTWINYNSNYITFINHVIDHAYQDDDSFFTAFIDKYYYLNYVNVNQQLLPGDLQKTLINSENASILEPHLDSTAKLENSIYEIETPLFLSTEFSNKGKSNYISEYSLLSNQGQILKTKGYRKQIYYYDHILNEKEPKKKFVNFYVNPIISKTQGDNYPKPLIPDNQTLKDNLIKKWVNIDYGNSHKEWNASKLINNHNLTELNKICLYTKVNGINFQVIRGARVPVEISISDIERNLKNKPKEGQEEPTPNLGYDPDNSFVRDEILSGAYYVQGIRYIYDKLTSPNLYTEYFLARREWPLSKK